MNVLIACEFSGTVRRAFRALGHDAWSCDLLPAEDGSPYHAHCDVFGVIDGQPWETNAGEISPSKWDMVIAHPPCTYLCNSGVRWLYKGGRGTERDPARWAGLDAGAKFFAELWNACDGVERVAFENPTMHWYAAERIVRWAHDCPMGKRVQFIDPRDFGHPETKRTGLHLRGLPTLVPTQRVHTEAAALSKGQRSRVHFASPGPDRWKLRSRTLEGIAAAMAAQWGAS